MLGEAAAMCSRMMERPLSFSPPPHLSEEAMASPVYTPVSQLWNKLAALNEEATALGHNNVIHFGPGAQLTQEIDGQQREVVITEQVAEMILEERRNKIVDSILVPCEQPLLEDPVPTRATGAEGKTSKKEKPKEPTRKSTRQQALTSYVPVSKRATHGLIKAFELAGPSEQIGLESMCKV
jgi:hypothetical protein